MLSQVGVPFGAVLEKSKKRRAIAPAVLGGCGGLDRLLESLPELWEGLEFMFDCFSTLLQHFQRPMMQMG